MSTSARVGRIAMVLLSLGAGMGRGSELDNAYYQEGPLAGSLKSADPLPIYDADPRHLWNRLFAAFYFRPSARADSPGAVPIHRIEGGDILDFLGWAKTTYWSEPATLEKLIGLTDEFIKADGAGLINKPLQRAVLQRDLWTVYDYYIGQNIWRIGSRETREQRDALCRRLAIVIRSLALTRQEIETLPNNYAAALESKRFVTQGPLDPALDYLPAGLLTKPDEWIEVDFFQPEIHEDISDRFVTLHTRSYRGRSYFRVFYRFPGGRPALDGYLDRLNRDGVDWKQAAQNGFIVLKPDAPQVPEGIELALVQFLITLDDRWQPTPTKIVESVRLRSYPTFDAASASRTNTGAGMNVIEYTMKRTLLFDNLRAGGLHREPDNSHPYLVLFQGPNDPDWGYDGRKALFQQCSDCHLARNLERRGVHSIPSIVHMGGFDAGAQLGVATMLPAETNEVRAKRAVKFKSRHETYRRLLEHLEQE